MKEILQGGLEVLLGCNLKLGHRMVGSDAALLSEEYEFARRSDQLSKFPATGLAEVVENELRMLEYTFRCSESFFVKTDCMCSAIDVWRLQTENSTDVIITFFSPHLWNLRMLSPNSFISFDISAIAYTISIFIAAGMERGVICNTMSRMRFYTSRAGAGKDGLCKNVVNIHSHICVKLLIAYFLILKKE